jgi:RNA polymerase sigma-70 factor (ECF subfamily)
MKSQPMPRSGSSDPLANADPPEAWLVERALAGYRDGWAGLVARHNHKVVVSLLARGLSIDEAKEIAQETWLKLIERQQAGRLSEIVLPGLAIVQAGFLASNARRRERYGAGQPAMGEVAAPRLEDAAIGREQLARVARALGDCPASARRVFEFVYEHPELSYAEVAREMALSTQRVKQIVCEVRARLRSALEKEER